MKIAIVYFEEKLSKDRESHQVNHFMLKGWQRNYQKSGTKAKPCLLLDAKTPCPNFWKYEYIKVEDDNPPDRKDVLNKVGWIKHQAYEILGKCVVMDMDAILKKPIDNLSKIKEQIAMAPDSATGKESPWSKNWPESKEKYNAGVLYLNSPKIKQRFREIWQERIEHLTFTFFDEIIFSAMMKEMGGEIIDTTYNTLWEGIDKDVHVLHFGGSSRKKDLKDYLQRIKMI